VDSLAVVLIRIKVARIEDAMILHVIAVDVMLLNEERFAFDLFVCYVRGEIV
jgi:hypothetical protein